MSRFVRSAFFPILIVIVLAVLIQVVWRSGGSSSTEPNYQGAAPSFVADLQAGKVASVVINTTGMTLQVTPVSGASYTVHYPDTLALSELLQDSQYANVKVTAVSPGPPWWRTAQVRAR